MNDTITLIELRNVILRGAARIKTNENDVHALLEIVREVLGKGAAQDDANDNVLAFACKLQVEIEQYTSSAEDYHTFDYIERWAPFTK